MKYLIKSPSIPLFQRGRFVHPQMSISGGFKILLNKGGHRGMCFFKSPLTRIIHKSGFKVFNFGQNCDFRFDFKLGFSAHETVLYLFLHFQVFDTSGVLFKA